MRGGLEGHGDDLATWQRLDVTAFMVSGIAAGRRRASRGGASCEARLTFGMESGGGWDDDLAVYRALGRARAVRAARPAAPGRRRSTCGSPRSISATSGIGRAFAERLASDGYDLIIVGRREERLREFAAAHREVDVRGVAADLSTEDGIGTVARMCADEPLDMLVNNAGVAHYMPLADLPAAKARELVNVELVNVKVLAPTQFMRAAIGPMRRRGTGTILNVARMIAFSGPADKSVMPRRAVYAGTLAYLVAMTQTLASEAEAEGSGVRVGVVCPGVVVTEFHSAQGMDLSAIPRMSADDVVTAALRGLELGEIVSAPGVEDYQLLQDVFTADLTAFGGQSPRLATRYTKEH